MPEDGTIASHHLSRLEKMLPTLLLLLVFSVSAGVPTVEESDDKITVSPVNRMYPFRPSGAGAFCSQWKPCQKGYACKIFHGGSHYGLGHCKRVVPIGHPCSNSAYICAEGTSCVNHAGSYRCRKMVAAGGKCSDQLRSICSSGLHCENGYCVTRGGYGSICGNKYKLCRKGFICAGENGAKTCKVEIKKGGKCGLRHTACGDGTNCAKFGKYGFLCVDVLGANEPCVGKYSMCKSGYFCEGGKCQTGAAEGEKCSTKRVCSAGLKCSLLGKEYRCVRTISSNESCNGKYMVCEEGMKCVGPSGKKKCTAPVRIGGKCSSFDNAYKLCGSGLKCTKSGDAHVCVSGLGANGNCTGQFSTCAEGYKCVGPTNDRKCRPPVSKGSSCGSSFEYCATGLTCYGSGDNAKCVTISSRGGGCNDQYSRCKAGLECRSEATGAIKKCMPSQKRGHGCDDGLYFCESGLQCLKYGKQKRCVEVVGSFGICSRSFTQCRDGLHCVGSGSRRKCVTRLLAGSECDNHYKRCSPGLHCYGGYCVRFLKSGAKCTSPHTRCIPGLYCRKYKDSKFCFRPVHRGYPCKHSSMPFLFCKGSLVCRGVGNSARCSNVVEKGGSCEGRYRYCKKGLACVGPKGSRRCHPLSPKGSPCGPNYQRCQNGLVCYSSTGTEYGKCYVVHAELERCNIKYTVCGPSLFCSGEKGQERCVKRKQYGLKCSAQEPCAEHLECKSGFCNKVVGLGHDCSQMFHSCKNGTACAGLPHLKQCVMRMGLNKRCDDPYWVCKAGLECATGNNSISTCVYAKSNNTQTSASGTASQLSAIPIPKESKNSTTALGYPIAQPSKSIFESWGIHFPGIGFAPTAH